MKSFSELDLEYFQTDLEDHVGTIRLDRPPANAHNIDVLLELQRVVETVRFDESVRAALFGSASEKFFSTGFDIKELQSESGKQVGYASQTSKEIIMKMRTTDTIFIAMVNGHCMGGGLELALACDFRFVGDDDGYNVGMPEIHLGLIAGEAGTQLLPRYIDRSTALKMMITGETLTPAEATERDIFDEIHPPDEVEDAAREFAEQIVEKSHMAVGHNKLAVNEGLELPLWDALAHERELQNRLLGSDVAKEGVDAFLGDHDPDFLGVELGDKEPGAPDEE
ncbi:Enoyl-CoA hydratase/carnithine racemase [Halorubrum aquaticum]|uniref:Short chain enoyl-CoA hydratase n=2 Tax=Halorubrum TaxID=56688 RepID=A0A521DJI4_9EURY|nr:MULTISPECIES: enoyl-CoA hydratase/isomerase family protein [Halorubrum]SFH43794.1 Enoyl-CoA hydratase/carnithine racemase [Halorubrum aquaticum]SMO71080.1 short chain enoyl-CoA hydratase [Halorubrum cibi]